MVEKKDKGIISQIGPGIVTGAADDDPSGIATYSQTGAQMGYQLLWTALYMLPMMIAVQDACARIGGVTGKSLADVIKKNYHQSVLYFVVIILLIANIINIGADIGAMAAAANLVVPINIKILSILFPIIMVLLEVFVSYTNYAKILKFLCLFLLAYPLSVFIVDQPWLELLKATVIPHVEFNFNFFFLLTALLGTTISPYMFFWESSQVVEEQQKAKRTPARAKAQDPVVTRDNRYFRNLRIENLMGMFFSEVATWSIIVVAATVLHAHHITDIRTAADAAKALEPLVQSFPQAGFVAKLIFSIGIIGLGFLAMPILAGASAYALSAALGFKKGLNLKFSQAKGFYSIIVIATLLGILIDLVNINPMKALVYAAVLNGIISIPLIFIIFLIAKNKKIMGQHTSGQLVNGLLFLTFICVIFSVGIMLLGFIK